jgi:hypothetical protein
MIIDGCSRRGTRRGRQKIPHRPTSSAKDISILILN